MTATIASTFPPRRSYGRVRFVSDPLDRQGVLGSQTNDQWWVWLLAPDEIETIEADRSANADVDVVMFNLDIAGVAVVGQETCGFEGDTQVSMTRDSWLSLIQSLGYVTPPAIQHLAGASMTSSAAWSQAEGKLRDVRRYLARGEDREALRAAYVSLDAISTNPYKSRWNEALDDSEVPSEKQDVFRALLQAHSQLLNRLGRHPSSKVNDDGDRVMLPLDHWEAELAVALTQLLLAGVERWRMIKRDHDNDGPVETVQH
jgi:hypothetical protein